jgi:hypothetical protein
MEMPNSYSATAYNENTGQSVKVTVLPGEYKNELLIDMRYVPAGLYYITLYVNLRTYQFKVIR